MIFDPLFLPKVGRHAVNELLTWGLPIFAGLALYGLTYAILQSASSNGDFWMARFWFVLGSLVLVARFLFWGMIANRPLSIRVFICGMMAVVLTAITIESLRSISHKQKRLSEAGLTSARKDHTALIKRLSEFVEEANHLLIENRQSVNPDWSKAKDWATRADAYITQNIAPETAAYFSMEGTPHRYPGGAVSREYVNWIHTRIERIGEIASEVRSSKPVPASFSHDDQKSDAVQLVDKLAAFRDEGNEILRRFSIDRTPSPYTEQFDDWKSRVQSYLDGVSTGFAHRFRSKTVEYQYPQAASVRTRTIADDMFTRIMRLEEFIRERTK